MRTALLAAASAVAFATAAMADEVLTVVTAGSENMVDYVTDYLGPKFEAAHPGVTVRVIGTGPGDAGSQAIYERLAAQRAAGVEAVDVDVAVVHQKMGGQMVSEGLLALYRSDIGTGALVSSPAAENALGTDVSGYVMPMFHSQTALAYNSALLAVPPGSYAELAQWVEENPGQFGHNGIRDGMSGVSFVIGWMYANTPDAEHLMAGPYDEAVTRSDAWTAALADLKDFNRHVTLTPGNAGTLDMLNRGEIAIGPVWVDMFYTWQADGRLSPDMRLVLPEPGMPGQPMYYVVPEGSPEGDLAREFIALATSPEVQAEGIVQRFNWYPGIDASHLEGTMPAEAWDALFVDITPQDLAAKGRTFPIADYFDAILEAYERSVE
ncbi:MAG: extracellular solute-binding protein [Alphaproteobacteria bacterium]